MPACDAVFTPKWSMFWFCSLMVLNYIERGAISSNGVNGEYKDDDCADACDDRYSKDCRDMCGFTGVQGEFNLTNEQVGLLASLFTAGLTVSAPLSAHAVRHAHPFLVIGIGQLVFCIGLTLCGFATSYEMLLLSRTLVGVSEPSFMVVAPAFIDKIAPKDKRSTWMGVFMMSVSIGVALGLGVGSFISGSGLDWRWSFRIQAALNIPYVFVFLTARPTLLMSFTEEEETKLLEARKLPGDKENPLSPHGEEPTERPPPTLNEVWTLFKRDAKELLGNKRYLLLVGAFVFFNMLGGVILFWGTKAIALRWDIDNTDAYFGAIVVVGGITGTLGGGIVLDKCGGGFRTATRLCAVFMIGSCICLSSMWWVPPSDPSPVPFFALLSVGYVLMSMFYAPAMATLLWVTEKKLRPQSIGLCNLIYHVLGDVPSPWYAGAIQDAVSDWPLVFTIITIPSLGLCAVCFVIVSFVDGREYAELE